jgi:hypothetical protein
LQVEPKIQKLYDYIRERGTILPINDYSQELLSQDDVHKRVAESIRSGEPLHLTTVLTLHPCNALGTEFHAAACVTCGCHSCTWWLMAGSCMFIQTQCLFN